MAPAVSHYLSLCEQALEDVDEDSRPLRNDNLSLAYSDAFDRLQSWSYSVGLSDGKFQRRLNQSPHLLDTVAAILQEISARLSYARQRLTLQLPNRDKVNDAEQVMLEVRHSIDRLFEMCSAFEDPALLPTPSSHSSEVEPAKLLDSSQNLTEMPADAAYDCLADYDTLFLVSNSTTSEGWRWDLAGQILYHSALRLLQYTPKHPSVRFSSRPRGVPDADLNIDEALEAFHRNRKPEGPPLTAQHLNHHLSAHASKASYAANKRRLNMIVIFADRIQEDVERAVLENGKKLRLLGVPEGQVILHLVHIGTDPFIERDLSSLRHYVKVDRAIQGTIEVQVVLFDIFAVTERTYQDVLLHDPNSRIYKPPLQGPTEYLGFGPFEIGVRLTFEDYGPIISLDLDKKPTMNGYTASVIYEHERDAGFAVESMNGERCAPLPRPAVLPLSNYCNGSRQQNDSMVIDLMAKKYRFIKRVPT
ncbi:hypothetical protein FQN54_001154 [Arachnomyces sp. PD_36]|nr:hypothetical protein FQN54_001154 [Arachnomyces sp. PD_36]